MVLGGVDSPGRRLLDGVGGGPVAAVGELAVGARSGCGPVRLRTVAPLPAAGGLGVEGAGGGAADGVDGVGGVLDSR